MTSIVKTKSGLIVPQAVQRKAGFKNGDVVEIRASGGVITILPKLPSADDDYTPEQRRAIDAELADAMKGPFYGPFDSADAMIAHMKTALKPKGTAKKTKTPR